MLRVGVVASGSAVGQKATGRLERLADDDPLAVTDSAPWVSVQPVGHGDPRVFNLVVGIGAPTGPDGSLADAWLDDSDQLFEAVDEVWHRRIRRFGENLAAGRRAPRQRRPVIVDADPTWPAQARRLIGRLDLALGDLVERIDHIGSTSVPGLPAKDLIDIQVVVADLDRAVEAARAVRHAGFVHVSGPWFGPGNEGWSHREEVCVDADPGRAVNVNIRPVDAPVWRDALLLRDWLRESADGRAEYATLKRSLAQRGDLDVDSYGQAKAAWVSTALLRAEAWAEGGTGGS
jgi:dephospho-CoA kinase